MKCFQRFQIDSFNDNDDLSSHFVHAAARAQLAIVVNLIFHTLSREVRKLNFPDKLLCVREGERGKAKVNNNKSMLKINEFLIEIEHH